MASESLRFIASYDDTIKFCGTNESLASRFRDSFAEAQGRSVTFDPVMAAASNPELLTNKTADIWNKKRKIGAFDATKFTKLFIKHMLAHFEDPTNESGEGVPPLVRSGFDAYAYLMAYESEIVGLYGKKEMSKLQMAALHFVEVGSEPVELDYVKYIASYDDLVLGTVSGNTESKPWEEFVPALGKWHYEECGRNEIMTGMRPVTEFFDGVKYIATYSAAQDAFKNEDGSVNETQAAIAYIAFGAQNGLVRNGFNHNLYLANYPELIEQDIYVNNEVSPVKVAKIWLERVKEGVDLSQFDALDFKETAGLEESADVFKSYVDLKVGEYMKLLKKQSKLMNRFTSKICKVPKFCKKSKSGKNTEETPAAEE